MSRETRFWVIGFLVVAFADAVIAVGRYIHHGEWFPYFDLAIVHVLVAALWWLKDDYRRQVTRLRAALLRRAA